MLSTLSTPNSLQLTSIETRKISLLTPISIPTPVIQYSSIILIPRLLQDNLAQWILLTFQNLLPLLIFMLPHLHCLLPSRLNRKKDSPIRMVPTLLQKIVCHLDPGDNLTHRIL